MKKLRAGIIGLGVGEAHIAGYRRHPSCEVVAICDFSDEKLSKAKEKYPELRASKEAGDLINSEDIDVISIASFDNFHFEQAEMALKNGKHLFIEKPICLHEDEFEKLHALKKSRPDLKISSNLILRASPRFQNLREKIQAGEMGRIYSLDSAYNYGRIHKLHSSWRGEIPYYSVVLGGAIHLVDLLLWLTGDRVEEVHAYGNAICSEGSQFKNEDFVLASLRFASGMVGRVTANFGCVFPHFHELSVYGTKATFQNGPPEARLYTSRDPQVAPTLISDAYPGTQKGDMICSFIESILSGKEPAVSWREITATMSICFAINRSLVERKPVQVTQY